jgi:hypothetical protein
MTNHAYEHRDNVVVRAVAAGWSWLAEHSIKIMCRVLEVSRSGFHAWPAAP